MKINKPIQIIEGTIILQCPPCSWNQCIFCGYSKDCHTQVQPSTEDLLRQLDYYFDIYGSTVNLEIYNSGSFLDDKQISPESRIALFNQLNKKGIECVTIESRPEFITREKIEPLTKLFKGRLTVAIGLEVADNFILKRLKKGFTLKDVEKAVSLLERMDIFSRAYLLVGPPFVKDPKTTAIESVRYAKEIGFTEIFLLGAYPMIDSKAYQLWKNKKWLLLKKDDFDKIIKLAQNIKEDIMFSSNGIEDFWRFEKK